MRPSGRLGSAPSFKLDAQTGCFMVRYWNTTGWGSKTDEFGWRKEIFSLISFILSCWSFDTFFGVFCLIHLCQQGSSCLTCISQGRNGSLDTTSKLCQKYRSTTWQFIFFICPLKIFGCVSALSSADSQLQTRQNPEQARYLQKVVFFFIIIIIPRWWCFQMSFWEDQHKYGNMSLRMCQVNLKSLRKKKVPLSFNGLWCEESNCVSLYYCAFTTAECGYL